MSRRGGWRRVGSRRRPRYEDARGWPVVDPQALQRIETLRIPPAWREVWISPNPRARLQAVGTDAAGRRQYLYHPTYRVAQEAAKYERLVRFGERLPALREVVVEHLDLPVTSREHVSALAVRLVNRAWFRVGSDRHSRRSRTYGVTTLTRRHVEVRGNRVTFRFRAKHRTLVRTTVVDERLSRSLRELLVLPGGARVFRYEDAAGRLVNLTGPALNRYLADHLGDGFTAKDFRTWGGTLTAAVALAEHGPPASEAEARRVIAAAMRRVGAELGNTPAVARASYVSPAVVEQYREGRTLESFRSRTERVLAAGETGLDVEERALLGLLRSWRLRRAA